AVYPPLVAVELGGGRHVRQVAAGARLRISLAPKLRDVEDPRQETLLLLGRSERDQRRPEQLFTEMVDLVRSVGLCVLLVEGHPVRGRQPAASVFDGPAQTGQSRGGQMLIPCPALLERLVLAPGSAKALERCEFADQIVGEPTAHPPPELL